MAGTGPPFSRRERWALCDLLHELGPDAPTLCEGWRSADLASHLVARDRRPDATPGMTLRARPFRRWTDRVQQGVRDTMTWDALVERLRAGPPALLRPIDPAINTIEYFVHYEDLRRAQPEWMARPLAPADEDQLWRYLRFAAKIARSPARRLEAPGREPLVLSKTSDGPLVKGPVSELVLWVSGRRSVAQVESLRVSG
ncbi:MAG TPA: TIGR03085 family metal-binding protein [Acidimicrobiales bacterium]|nr:TIGR03085 family metal-binding protein [Acidimicrobiales bacterium]